MYSMYYLILTKPYLIRAPENSQGPRIHLHRDTLAMGKSPERLPATLDTDGAAFFRVGAFSGIGAYGVGICNRCQLLYSLKGPKPKALIGKGGSQCRRIATGICGPEGAIFLVPTLVLAVLFCGFPNPANAQDGIPYPQPSNPEPYKI